MIVVLKWQKQENYSQPRLILTGRLLLLEHSVALFWDGVSIGSLLKLIQKKPPFLGSDPGGLTPILAG